MRKFHFLIFLFFTFLVVFTFNITTFNITNAGGNDTWVSCCSSGCNYTFNQSLSVGGTTYYCCPNGWQTSPCCSRSNPSIFISPSSQTGSPGQTLTYSVSIKNNDVACGVSFFNLTFQSCPSGFTCKFISCLQIEGEEYCLDYDSISIPLGSGETKFIDINVTSSSSSPAGTYTFTVKATNQNAPSYSSTASASYVISTQTYSATFYQSGIPSGITWGVTVGGTRYTSTSSSITVSGLSGTVSYSYDSFVSGASGTRYACSSGCSGSVSSTSNTASASYKTQYQLTMAVNPTGAGTTSPAVGSYWYDAGTSLTISATPNPGYTFSSWSGSGTGSYTGTANPASITMNSPITETANFATTSLPPYCNQTSPQVYILTPFIVSGGNLTVSVYFECREWYNPSNLTLSLKIDDQEWKECFLNNIGLMRELGWSSDCDMTRRMSGSCGSDSKWSCSQGTCHRMYNSWPIWVKSNFNSRSLNVTFTCKLPYLSGGSHNLTVTAKVYGSEIALKPSVVTFRVGEVDGRKIIELLLLPFKILRRIFPF